MQVKAIQGDITAIEVDVAIVNLFAGIIQPDGATGAMDRLLDGAITELISDGELKGTLGQMTLIHTLGRIPAKRVLVIGLGNAALFGLDTIRRISAESGRFLRNLGVTRVAAITPGAIIAGIGPEAAAQAFTEGMLMGLYSFNKYREQSRENPQEFAEFLLVDQEQNKIKMLQTGIATGLVIAEATALARDLVNTPGNDMTPSHLAEEAGKLAKTHGLELDVLEKRQCQDLGMGAFLSVTQGSSQPPKFIVLKYSGDPDRPENNLGLIGKGVTFDSGGISLKPASGMGAMKGDMAGGASVIAAMQAIGTFKPTINVTAIVAATENMPGSTATKPGDVVKAMNGKTIEVDNTDAEGRLTLADALIYAKNLGLNRIIDVATLTGAIKVALGQVRMGLFTNNQALANKVLEAGEITGEKMWQLPMDEEYKELNKSDVADLKNTGGPAAGSITAALFVGEFAGETPWVHLDIAAVNMTDKERGLFVKGATGISVRALIHLTKDLANTSS
jgi:leucyl aminopeptidase